MTAPTLFNSPMSGYIRQESLRNYNQQLTEKKAHLVTAKESYLNALELIGQYHQKVTAAKKQIDLIKNELSESREVEKTKKLESQKQQYERFIAAAPEKLASITQRLNQLNENLQGLEANIGTLTEQNRKSLNTSSPGAGA
ncbi:hypothetical protein TUM19329_18340 [Legionella antarctica]|uniref:Uncharacterized protein n=1 Tax=Legionella antarctica TaxID=2708020 RepID=A0A6F8T5I9_9GAMM|nr:hypothetical protein [Legionella antarctica]BCA95473.1 hypothetical protein TUM19329_18340 [Legionella antarctica]